MAGNLNLVTLILLITARGDNKTKFIQNIKRWIRSFFVIFHSSSQTAFDGHMYVLYTVPKKTFTSKTF